MLVSDQCLFRSTVRSVPLRYLAGFSFIGHARDASIDTACGIVLATPTVPAGTHTKTTTTSACLGRLSP